MSSALKFIAELMIIILFIGIIFDYGQIKSTKALIKDTVDLSTKAAALQIDEDSTKIGSGVFEINEGKAKKVVEEFFKQNTNEEFYNSLVITTNVINAHSEQTYTAPNGQSYTISDPTVFCIVNYKYDGMVFDENITVNIMSGSVLKNKNDL